MEDFSLNLDNLLDADELSRISGDLEIEQVEPPVKNEAVKQETKEQTTVENVDVNDLFGHSESVDGDDNNQGREDTTKDNRGSSPNIYSSIAKDYKDGGVFSHLDDEEISKIDSIESFKEAFDKAIESEVDSRLDDAQKRINEALGYGIEPTDIQKFEKTISYLDGITDDDINDESDSGATLRRNLIYSDYINKGMSKERAQKLTEKSFENSTDLEDAAEALEGNRQFYQDEYKKLIAEAKKVSDDIKKNNELKVASIQKSILDKNSELISGITIDTNMRRKIVDNITKPVYRDPNTGKYYTALQKWSMDNDEDFAKIIGTLFTITDGFKSFDKIISKEVNKINKKSLSNLADAINSTSRNSDGSFKLVSGVSTDKNSYFGSDDWALDLS